MLVYDDKNDFFYCNRPCRNRLSRRHGTILENMKITYKKFLMFCHYYFHKTMITKNIIRDVGLSRTTITKLKYRIENKIILFNKKSQLKLGGMDSIVEIDESLMASAKYGKGRYPEQTWVFGIIERETGRCYIKVVEDRKRSTLEKIINEIVVKSTIVCTDQAKVYGSLNEIGYIHFDVCHKRNFVDPETGCHTQTIESLWNHFKKKKHMEYGIARKLLEAYCEIFTFFHNNQNISFENFMKLLQ
ncbi:hypothetical protein DMUE_5527 [Dictyocoela muelleri]|nr:hypothetical protein DMUE_5527 [Dictyocoela muelleri]